MNRLAALAPLMLLAAPSHAAMAQAGASQPCPITYPQFYAAVKHVDLATCPAELEGPSRFCRLVAGANGQEHVFVFTVEGAQCLLDVRAFTPGSVTLASR